MDGEGGLGTSPVALHRSILLLVPFPLRALLYTLSFHYFFSPSFLFSLHHPHDFPFSSARLIPPIIIPRVFSRLPPGFARGKGRLRGNEDLNCRLCNALTTATTVMKLYYPLFREARRRSDSKHIGNTVRRREERWGEKRVRRGRRLKRRIVDETELIRGAARRPPVFPSTTTPPPLFNSLVYLVYS